MAADPSGRPHAAACADRLGQDARGVPGGDRPAVLGAAAGARPANEGALPVAASRARRRHREEPAGAARRDRPRGGAGGRDARARPHRGRSHRRHRRARASATAPRAPRHLDHDARVAVPAAHISGARNPPRGRDRDRRRDPLGGGDEARLPSDALARAARGDRRAVAATDRIVGDAAAARGDRDVPRRVRRAEPPETRHGDRRGRAKDLGPRGRSCRSRTCARSARPWRRPRRRWATPRSAPTVCRSGPRSIPCCSR